MILYGVRMLPCHFIVVVGAEAFILDFGSPGTSITLSREPNALTSIPILTDLLLLPSLQKVR